MALNKKKMQFCFNKMALHPTSVMRYKMPECQISSLVDWKRETNTVSLMKPRPLITGFFSVVIYTRPTLHNAENLRFTSYAREN
jgi:hypothetical protein